MLNTSVAEVAFVLLELGNIFFYIGLVGSWSTTSELHFVIF